mmetsp:Transcript_7776/g.20319  ORF Transcript_7776/g.20319 Transcript_7776/m.20319 type:complete len:220 (+) Transcript_7776:1690-2349(+)
MRRSPTSAACCLSSSRRARDALSFSSRRSGRRSSSRSSCIDLRSPPPLSTAIVRSASASTLWPPFGEARPLCSLRLTLRHVGSMFLSACTSSTTSYRATSTRTSIGLAAPAAWAATALPSPFSPMPTARSVATWSPCYKRAARSALTGSFASRLKEAARVATLDAPSLADATTGKMRKCGSTGTTAAPSRACRACRACKACTPCKACKACTLCKAWSSQ